MKGDIHNRADIAAIVETFYADVRRDPDLGYLFDEVAKVDWATHTPHIIDFWESVVLGTVTYTRNAMTPHFLLHKKAPLTGSHFERWLKLFREAVHKNHSGPRTELMIQRAESVAALMQHKLSADEHGLRPVIRDK